MRDGRVGCWRVVDRHRSCADIVGLSCAHLIHPELSGTASLRILVVNNAPFPRLSHALCANMRDPHRAIEAINPLELNPDSCSVQCFSLPPAVALSP